MWLLSFLPSSILAFLVNAILLIGIVGVTVSSLFKYVIKYLPWLVPHRTILQVVSVLLLSLGIYFKGGQVVEEKWRARVAELEAQVAAAEQLTKFANEQLEAKIKEKTKVVKETQVVVKEKIKTVEVKIDSGCKITNESVDILNQAAGVKK